MRSDALHRFAPSRADFSVPGATCARRVLRHGSAAEDRSCERPERLSSFRSAMRFAVRAFPSRACARVEWAWPVCGIRFRAGACSRCSPDPSLSRFGSSTALSIRSSPVRAPSRLDRARAPRGTRAAAIPVRSTDICNPQDFFFNDESDRLGVLRIVFPRDSGAPGSTPEARFGGPCTASRHLCAPRHFLRVTPHGVPLTSLVGFRRERSGRAPRSRIARAPSRAPSRRVNGRAGRFDSGRLPLFSCLPPRPTDRPERVALHRSSRTIARATQQELLQLSPTLGHFSAPQAPASHESGNARPKPGAPSPLRFTREEDRRRHLRAGEMRSRGPRSSCSWEQARPRSSTFTPRHLRHRLATFGDWVLLRVHVATQIELPRSGAFFRRFPSEASAPLEPFSPCERERRAFEKHAPESTPFFPARAEAP
jgi:hypothetical protein